MPELEFPSRQIAVIDIGSNSVRLVLYRLEGRAVWTMFNEKVLAGLGRDIAVNGKLSESGVEMAMVALRRFAALIDGVQPDMILTAATAAVREASDGPDFCKRVQDETGLEIRVLSGEEEAKYAALGVLSGAPASKGVVGDLGGASLELNRLGASGPGITLPLGPFVLSGGKDFDAKRVQNRIKKVLANVPDAYRCKVFNAVGGAWRTLAQIHMEMSDHPLRIVHQYSISADEARELAEWVLEQNRVSLEKHSGVSKRRAETLPYAALNLIGLIDHLGIETINFSAWGVREGILHGEMEAKMQAVDPLLAGCSAWGGRQGVDPALPRALDGWLQPVASALPDVFGEERDALLTSAACRLADLGARLHPEHRPELVFDQVLWAPIAGQTHAERAFMAMTLYARYGGTAKTPRADTVNRLLSEQGQKRARALGMAMRLACDLSGRSPQLLANAAISIGKTQLKVTAVKGYASMLLGSQTKRRAKALADALDLELADF